MLSKYTKSVLGALFVLTLAFFAVTGQGRHTSTSAVMLALPDEAGWIVDTPGIRSFGLAHVQPERLIEAFPDLDEMVEECPRGCSHGTGEPECGLDDAVAWVRARRLTSIMA